MLKPWPLAGLVLMLAVAAPIRASTDDCVVILMHGKWGNVQHVSSFGRQLAPACAYETLEMPWSLRRNYDAPYPAALDEIAGVVAAQRAKGIRRVLLAGHSFGANATLAYMAERGDVDGILAIGPGHVPATFYHRGLTRDAVDNARKMIASGQGDDKGWFDDVNQGQRKSIRTSANIYFSYFDPVGIADMPSSAARFKRAIPFLWLIGAADGLQAAGQHYAFSKAPAHPKSRYAVINADHIGVLDGNGAALAREWIEALDAP
jgi:pimeloyl-ACP methyl ester carboxylesterase